MNVIHAHKIHIHTFCEFTRMLVTIIDPTMSHPNNPAICAILSILDALNHEAILITIKMTTLVINCRPMFLENIQNMSVSKNTPQSPNIAPEAPTLIILLSLK